MILWIQVGEESSQIVFPVFCSWQVFPPFSHESFARPCTSSRQVVMRINWSMAIFWIQVGEEVHKLASFSFFWFIDKFFPSFSRESFASLHNNLSRQVVTRGNWSMAMFWIQVWQEVHNLFLLFFFVSWQIFPGFIFSWIFCALAQALTR